MSDDNNVEVQFGSNTAGFDSGAENVKETLDDVGKNVEQAEELFKYLGERMAEVFALHEIIDFPERISEIGEKIERMAAMTGLSAESIQTLSFAMERTGGDAEGAGMMMTRLERNIEAAAAGTGPAYEAFHRLGVSLDE